jgi:hypothetical protein
MGSPPKTKLEDMKINLEPYLSAAEQTLIKAAEFNASASFGLA